MFDLNAFIQQVLDSVKPQLQAAYDAGVADGKAQSPDLAAALAADHEALGSAVAEILEKDEEEVTAALAKLKDEVAKAIKPSA